MDLNRLTIKSQQALEAAHQQAAARNHQTIEPEHILVALLSDPDGIVYPLLTQLGIPPKAVRDQVDAPVASETHERQNAVGPLEAAGHRKR